MRMISLIPAWRLPCALYSQGHLWVTICSMIDPNFRPPEPTVSREETVKRQKILPWIKDYFDDVTSGIFIGGSLSYGANYSVTKSSDIDVQLVLDDGALDRLLLLDLYEQSELEQAVLGYKRGIYQQFSLVGTKDGVSIESHFWGKDAFVEAIDYSSNKTPRLRSSIATPSTDYGFSFDGTSDAVDFYGEMVEGFPVSLLPSYRVIDTKLYLCRPIATILGGPIILKTNNYLDSAIERCWTITIEQLRQARIKSADGKNLTIVNALPGKYKMSPEVKDALLVKTESLLSS